MAELTAKSPCAGRLPLTIGAATVTEETLGPMTSIAPYRGRQADLAAALAAAHGLGWPQPNRSLTGAGVRLIWFGRDQALLTGAVADPALEDMAALADQSDAWAAVRLQGEAAEAVLARLVPVDLRRAVFAPGATLRSQLGHMPASLTRLDDHGFLILVYRSMAGTLLHDLKTAMEAAAARG
ncbi:sarcosine oxidase subunit gamma [Pseudodonghicola flavimaris]|uniref:Sarcosine oxidase subunit gamma n=1 Tax=Pseudodonghicola flavimaris TaxID=3050036 RepID=A0ABT7F4D2_9RHOB|nr:sarcosine oxidase subunit gamma [Pseudodonghicola flavimaris]MDK3019471.1 sarcosine oxidase subunit gamma [Pseudodonghicola flavimaris]